MAYLGYWLNTVLYTNISRLRLAGPGLKPARWFHIHIHIVRISRVFSFYYIPSWPLNIQICIFFFNLYISNWTPTTTYICESWCASPLSFFPFFFCLFPLLPIFFLHICIIMYPLRVVILSSIAYFVNPPVWCFRLVTASITLFYISSFVMCKFAMFVYYIL